MKAVRAESAERTIDSSPALSVLGSSAESSAEPVERATENDRRRSRDLTNSLSPASRAAIVNDELIPAMNRWAIFVRPLRGLIDKASFMNNAG